MPKFPACRSHQWNMPIENGEEIWIVLNFQNKHPIEPLIKQTSILFHAWINSNSSLIISRVRAASCAIAADQSHGLVGLGRQLSPSHPVDGWATSPAQHHGQVIPWDAAIGSLGRGETPCQASTLVVSARWIKCLLCRRHSHLSHTEIPFSCRGKNPWPPYIPDLNPLDFFSVCNGGCFSSEV